MQATIPRKLESMTEEVVFGSEKRTVVLNLPCIEKPTVYYGKKIETAEARCYTSAKLTSVITSHTVPIKLVKDALLSLSSNDMIYFYECHCGIRMKA